MTQHVYAIRAGKAGPIKIGKSKNPWNRMHELGTGHYEDLNLVTLLSCSEEKAHESLAVHRIHREWFRPHPEVLIFIWLFSDPFDVDLFNDEVADFFCSCGHRAWAHLPGVWGEKCECFDGQDGPCDCSGGFYRWRAA